MMVYPFDKEETWVERVNRTIVYEAMNQMTEAMLTQYIGQIDYEDFQFRESNADRTFAKMLCYTYRAQIQFKRELAVYCRQYGEFEGRSRLEAEYKIKYPIIDMTGI